MGIETTRSAPAVLLAWPAVLGAQPSTVEERLAGMRETARRLSESSAADQAVPILVAIAIAAGVTAGGYLVWQRIRSANDHRAMLRRTGLTPDDVEWLVRVARSARLEAPTRILRSARVFEQVMGRYLCERRSTSDDWHRDARRARDLAHRLGFVASPPPERLDSTHDLGVPWPVTVSGADPRDRTDAFVASDTGDRLVLRLVDDLRLFDALDSGHTLRLLATTPDRPGQCAFDCRVTSVERRPPYRTIELEHTAPPPGPPAGAGTEEAADSAPEGREAAR